MRGKRGFLTFQFVILIAVMMIVLSSGAAYTSNLIKNIKTNDLKMECSVLDRSLESWAKSHKAVQESSITYTEGRVAYTQKRLYPKTLADLGELQSRGFFSKKIDLTKFNYITRDDGTAYQLEVYLPNGTIYKSPQSSF